VLVLEVLVEGGAGGAGLLDYVGDGGLLNPLLPTTRIIAARIKSRRVSVDIGLYQVVEKLRSTFIIAA